ncbi:MAG: rRNA maturation RNase YbeY [Cloacibacillus sp.]
MKATIYCGEIASAAETNFCCNETIKKIEEAIGEYLSENKPLPAAAEEAEISLTFVDEAQMADMNDEYRDVAGPTDVLSFPMWENEDGNFEPPTDWSTLTLGDIIVCPEIVKKNADEIGKSEKSETILVICHGFLHLIGFDHADEDEKNRMWLAQEALVKRVEEL